MTHTVPLINLLKKEEGGFDQFIKWSLTIGKGIIIITEIIALLAFLYRFSLDAKISNLQDIIKDKQRQLTLLQKDEQDYRSLHARLNILQPLLPLGKKLVDGYSSMLSIPPNGIIYRNIHYKDGAISINASAQSPTILTLFLNKVNTASFVESAAISNIDTKAGSGLIIFTMSVNLKNVRKATPTPANGK